MAVIKKFSFGEFCDAFASMGRGDQFSYAGKQALFDYLVDYGPVELDVIALCCEYTEDSTENIVEDSCIDVSDAGGDMDEIKATVREYLRENTIIIGETASGFIYANW